MLILLILQGWWTVINFLIYSLEKDNFQSLRKAVEFHGIFMK